MKKISFLLLLVFDISLWANDLEDLFNNSYQRDSELRTLVYQGENNDITWNKEQLKPGLGLSVGQGEKAEDSFVSVAKEDGTTTVSGNPQFAVTLPYPLQTQIAVSSPLSIDLSDNDKRNVPINISIKQPLNGLKSLRNDSEVPALQYNRERRDNLFAIHSRKMAINKEVLTILKDIIINEKKIIEKQFELISEEKNLAQQISLGAIKVDSSQYFSRDLAIRKLSRELAAIQATYNRYVKQLELFTGISEIEFHQLIDEVDISSLRDSFIPENTINPSIEQASSNRHIAEKKLMEASKSKKGEINLNGGYRLNNPGASGQENIVSAGVSGMFDTFSLSTSVEGAIEKKALSLSLEFSWSLPDKRAERLENSKLKNERDIALINEDQAEKKLTDTLQLLSIEFNSLINQEESLQEDFVIAERNEKDNRGYFASGLIPEKDLDNAVFEQEKLVYDHKILQIDKFLFITKINIHFVDLNLRREL